MTRHFTRDCTVRQRHCAPWGILSLHWLFTIGDGSPKCGQLQTRHPEGRGNFGKDCAGETYRCYSSPEERQRIPGEVGPKDLRRDPRRDPPEEEDLRRDQTVDGA